MFKARITGRITAAASLLLAAACADLPTPSEERNIQPGGDANLGAAAGRPAGHGRPDHVSERLASQVPQFGGVYADETGGFSVYLTDPGALGAFRAALARELAGAGRDEKPVRVLRGQYRFTELSGWLDRLTPVLGGAELAFTEVDERHNRIRIGVASEAGRSVVQGALRQTGVPDGAVLVDVVQRPQPYFGPRLSSRLNPHRAGAEIIFRTPAAPGGVVPCTYGWNVMWEGRKYMLVNSHCTSTFGGPTVDTEIFQPIVPEYEKDRADYQVGKEVQDPNLRFDLYGCNTSVAFQGCRYADAALVEIRNTNRGWDLGGVHRTRSRTTLPLYYGTRDLDANNVNFEMYATLSTLFVGDTVNKVGRTTGWTGGVVTSTCRTIYVDARGYVCSGSVSGPAGRGDSGSPVFWTDGQGRHYVVGMLFSGIPNHNGEVGDNYNFSHHRYIDYELGQPSLYDLTWTDASPVASFSYSEPGTSGDMSKYDSGGGPADCTVDPTLPC